MPDEKFPSTDGTKTPKQKLEAKTGGELFDDLVKGIKEHGPVGLDEYLKEGIANLEISVESLQDLHLAIEQALGLKK